METDSRPTVSLRDLVLYYLRLGALGFGGPVALCGQMERELVQERKWLSRDEMRDGIAVSNRSRDLSRSRSEFSSPICAAASGERGRADGRSSCRTSLSCPRLAPFTFTSAGCQS